MNKMLVAYFSASGITAKIAEQLSEAIGADLHEIKPKVSYTHDDLDWQNDQSRSSIEMKDKSYRPEIIVDEIDMSKYNTIFLGFPIWWYVAPTIINTFLESYNFEGKTIVIFATSGSSDFGNTIDELKVSLPESVKLIEGKVLNGKYKNIDLSDWAEEILK